MSGLRYGIITPEGKFMSQYHLGNYAFRDHRVARLCISDDGTVHLLSSMGGIWRNTGVFTDEDILYRHINLAAVAPSGEDKVMEIRRVPNLGDRTG